MISTLQKAKHWHLFTITFGIPFLVQMIYMIQMMAKMFSEDFIDTESITNQMSFIQILMVLLMSVMFFWYWAVTIGLQYKVPEGVKMKVKKFKFFYFFFLIYMIVFVVFTNRFMKTPPSYDETYVFQPFGIIWAIIFPLHMFAMFCILYVVYFSAKTIRTVELQREVKFSDFVGEFFMILLYPIGIWLIQPKVNQFIQESANTTNTR